MTNLYRFVVYRDAVNEWRWSLVAGNHKVVADSAEGYLQRADCKAAIGLVKRFAPSAMVDGEE